MKFRHRRLRGEQSGIPGGGSVGVRNDDRKNDDDGKIGDHGEDGDD